MTPLDLEIRHFDLTLADRIPAGLRGILERVSRESYSELYEASTVSSLDLEGALWLVVEGCGQYSQNAKASYGYLALILGMAVAPTIRCYLPNEDFTRHFFMALAKGGAMELPVKIELQKYHKGFLGQYQALDEAMLVLENSLAVMTSDHAPAMLVAMLDLCLEGYAIFPGSSGRRALLEWCLWEAVPAACLGIFSPHLYTIKGLIDSEESLKVLGTDFALLGIKK